MIWLGEFAACWSEDCAVCHWWVDCSHVSFMLYCIAQFQYFFVSCLDNWENLVLKTPSIIVLQAVIYPFRWSCGGLVYIYNFCLLPSCLLMSDDIFVCLCAFYLNYSLSGVSIIIPIWFCFCLCAMSFFKPFIWVYNSGMRIFVDVSVLGSI